MTDYRRIAAEFGAKFVDLANVKFTRDLLGCIPSNLIRKYRALPIACSSSRIVIAMSDPSDLTALDGLHSASGKEIELCVADKSQLDAFIERLHGDEKS
jgi:hypothetical protein